MNVGKNRKGLMSDINVTPFVDVMLVLLIIFMVTAPMMMQGTFKRQRVNPGMAIMGHLVVINETV